MNRSRRVNLLSFLILLGFFFSLIYHYAQGYYLSNSYPANTFLFLPKYSFSDFGVIYNESISLNPYMEAKSGQFPFMILIGKVLTVLPAFSALVFFILFCSTVFFWIATTFLTTQSLLEQTTSIFVICFFSYPFLFTVERGNFELLLFSFLLIFLYLFVKKKHLWSTIPLSMAIAMKAYPAILLVLFLVEKKWKEAIITVGLTIVLTVISLSLFQGGFVANLNYLLSLSNFSNNDTFVEFTSIEPGTVIQRGVTLLSLIKIILQNNQIAPSQFWLNNYKIIYISASALLGIAVIIYILLSHQKLWKTVSILILLMLLLPPISGEYKLIHMYIPLFLFCFEENSSKLDYLNILLFTILMIPKNYYYYPLLISDATINSTRQHDISSGMTINICTLIFFTLILLFSEKFERGSRSIPSSLTSG